MIKAELEKKIKGLEALLDADNRTIEYLGEIISRQEHTISSLKGQLPVQGEEIKRLRRLAKRMENRWQISSKSNALFVKHNIRVEETLWKVAGMSGHLSADMLRLRREAQNVIIDRAKTNFLR